MKKILVCLIIILGSTGVYFGLCKINEPQKTVTNKQIAKVEEAENKEVLPNIDDFVSEAVKLQILAEEKAGNDTCKCFSLNEIDSNTTLSGSILVYTVDDLYTSSLWLSNGYYLIDGSENASTGVVEESSETASLYCGESSKNIKSNLCAKSY